MEIEVLSVQCIKPFCPTPNHPKTHKLSILDQFVPAIYMPLVLFYSIGESPQAISDNGNTQQKLKQLKESLSKVLTHFYPFAGRVKDKLTIDCNDEGVHYVEAKVNCTLPEFFNHSNFSSFIHELVPNQPLMEVATEGYTTMAQVTCFACGGMAIGTLIYHKIADGTSASFFLNSWSSNSRNVFHFQREFEFPNFVTPFPHNIKCPQDTNVMNMWGQFLNDGRRSVRRLLFDAKAILRLKAQGSSLTVQNPTRVEVVTSFLCKCAAKAFNVTSGLERPTLIGHAVNMRPRASPSIPKSSMGNIGWLTMALMSANELPDLVIKLREAVRTINSDFVKNFIGEEGFVEHSKKLIEIASSVATLTKGVNFIYFTSWCNFGFHDVDYGWGKPIWASSIFDSLDDSLHFNSVILMDTPSGNGIEAWVDLNEDEMVILQDDKELLEFVTLDPNPLKEYITHT
ncbi:hypothetical protein VNO78_20952 [Psophocarpus tetragonolobus]|uniref:Uncharacterized protein n=1 Tax=Psophocarpus tetragonolobus TaxID=3891 RepID=A0AAN9XHP7_PSOTE